MVAEGRGYDRPVVDGGISLTLDDGRVLEAWRGGADGTSAVLFHVGTPSAGIAYEPMVSVATDRGLGFLTYSRPGYGASTRRPGRSVADCAADVATLAERLGLERLFVVGWSGGGPHALACAALLPELVASAATLAGVAPYAAEGLDWLDGMAEENLDEFGAAIEGGDALQDFLERAADDVRGRTGANVADALGGLVTDVDRRALGGPLADYLALLNREAVSHGIWGWLDDDLAFSRDWGFRLDDVTVPVTVWQGRQDAMVPFAHGEWLARHVPEARAMLLEEEGHLSLVLRLDEVVEQLLGDAAT